MEWVVEIVCQNGGIHSICDARACTVKDNVVFGWSLLASVVMLKRSVYRYDDRVLILHI